MKDDNDIANSNFKFLFKQLDKLDKLEATIKALDNRLMRQEELLIEHCVQLNQKLKSLQTSLVYLETAMKTVLVTQSIYDERIEALEEKDA